jgi:AraC-like DNA-binding protein
MNVYFDWIVVFQIFCIVQGLTTGIYFLMSKNKQPSHYWLGLLLLGMSFQIIDYFLSRSGVYYRNRWLYFSPFFFSLGFGPLFYFYVKSLLQKSFRLRAWHFVPVTIQVLFYLILAIQPLSVKADFWQFVHKPYTRYLEYYGTCFSVFCYLGISIRLLRGAGEPFRRLYNFVVGLVFFYAVAAIDPIFNHYYLPAQAPKFYLTALVLPVFTYWLALISLFRKPMAALPKKSLELPLDKDKVQQLIQAMRQSQLYKDPDLSLPALAQHLGLGTNEVSRLINVGLNKSFADFVNDFRLDEVKERLLKGEDAQFTLLGIALEAGFGSKTTFNRVFKEQTGMAPKSYKKSAHFTQRDDGLVARS